MKKILISAMLIVMGCFSMAAQNSIVNNPDNKAYFGIRVGGNLTCPGKLTSDYKYIRYPIDIQRVQCNNRKLRTNLEPIKTTKRERGRNDLFSCYPVLYS